MPVTEHVGDLFTSDAPVLAHGVNCAGAMGRGVAVEFRRRWPALYRGYRYECRWGRLTPGGVWWWDNPGPGGPDVANLATQAHWRSPAELEWVGLAVDRLVVGCSARGVDRVGMPRVGAGLGGLRWPDVRAVLDEGVPPWLTVEVWSLPARDAGPPPTR